MHTLYARLEPTTDSTLLSMEPNSKRRDTVVYEDKACTQEKARIPWYHKNRPISRKTLMLNCNQYALEWLK
jgi:hypothetical protein